MSEAIEQLSRAVLAQIGTPHALAGDALPLTGTRASGAALIKATGANVVLAPNAYAFLGVNGTVMDQLLVKVRPNPATADGTWTITAAGVAVTIGANVGGARYNSAGKDVRVHWDPPLAGVELVSALSTPLTGGVDGEVKDTAIYDQVGDLRQIFDSGVGAFPAVVVSWLGTEPAEGRTGGMHQGLTRKSRATRIMMEQLSIFVTASTVAGGGVRAREGRRILEKISSLLTDRSQNDDGEQLTSIATGLEVMQRVNFRTGAAAWIYMVRVRAAQSLTRVDPRVFVPFLRERGQVDFPAAPSPPAPPPGQPLDKPGTDVTANIPQDP